MADQDARSAAQGRKWVVIDRTTNNQLGEFGTQEEALAFIEEIRPLGRFSPDGHDLRAVRLSLLGNLTPAQFNALRSMIEEWIDEGFTTPPYTAEQYDIFEALDITEPVGLCGYDIRRPL